MKFHIRFMIYYVELIILARYIKVVSVRDKLIYLGKRGDKHYGVLYIE